jgi:hypothetical protein
LVRRYAHLAVGRLAPFASKAGIAVSNDNRAKAPSGAANDNPAGTNW